jgi:hypothetical protein
MMSVDDEDDLHPPLSPPRTAERLFGLGDLLDTQNISAAALAQQIRHTDRTSTGFTGGTTIATDDFRSAVEPPPNSSPFRAISSAVLSRLAPPAPPSDILTTTLISNNFADDLSTDSDYLHDKEGDDGNDHFEEAISGGNLNKVLVVSSEVPEITSKLNLSHIPESVEETDLSMSTATPSTPDEQPMHIDAAEKIYDTAKDVWTWGKGIFFVSPFLGIAEGVAGKVVSVATGESLESVDRVVTDQVQTLDDKIFNPAIAFIVQIVLNAAGSTEETLKPIIIKILTPFGLMKTTAENPELTPVPGVTVTQS